MAFPTGWGRKCKITIPDAKIAGSNSNFPVLLTKDNFPTEMIDAGANSALNGGGDVRFSEDAAGVTQLACDVVSFVTSATPSSQDAIIWVKFPTLNTGAAKDIYVWYNKAGETQPIVTDPYGRNAVWTDYEFALHLKGGDITDSSGKTSPAAIGALAGTRAGPSGWDVIDLSGIDEGINLGVVADTTGNISLQAWALTDDNSDFGTIVSRRNGSDWNYQWRAEFGDPAILIGSGSPNDPGAVLSLATWYFLGITISGTTITFYRAGASSGTGAVSGTRTLQPTIDTTIGLNVDNLHDWNGGLSEVRVRLDVLSADWITTEYNNQSDPATFATAGTPEAAGGGTIVSIAGVAAASGIGSLTTQSDADILLTGASATGQVGTLTVSTSTNQTVTLTGLEATGQVGTVAVLSSPTITLTGVSSTGQVGILNTVSGDSLTITGVTSTGSVGILSIQSDTSVTLSGLLASGQVGTVVVPQNGSASVAGVTSTGSAGLLTVSLSGEWAIQATASGSWTIQPASSDTWTDQTVTSGTWTIQ